MAKEYMKKKGIDCVEGGVTTTDNVEQIFNNFKMEGVDCVYIPTDNLLANCIPIMEFYSFAVSGNKLGKFVPKTLIGLIKCSMLDMLFIIWNKERKLSKRRIL